MFDTEHGAAKCKEPMPAGLGLSRDTVVQAVISLCDDRRQAETCGGFLDRLTDMLGVDMRPHHTSPGARKAYCLIDRIGMSLIDYSGMFRDGKFTESEIKLAKHGHDIQQFVQSLSNEESCRRGALANVCSFCGQAGHYDSEFVGRCAVGARFIYETDGGAVLKGVVQEVKFVAGKFIVVVDETNEERTIDHGEHEYFRGGRLRVLPREEAAGGAAAANSTSDAAATNTAAVKAMSEDSENTITPTAEQPARVLKRQRASGLTLAPDPYGARSSKCEANNPTCVVCQRDDLKDSCMSFCGYCQGFACDDGHGRSCGSYFAPQREEYTAAIFGDAAEAEYIKDMAEYSAACEARGEFPDEEVGLFTCNPCEKEWNPHNE
tara:strand:- start:454 stop:1587 length:1134 start_codon:yes stop_codon:yes gene_type:complete